MIKDLLFPKFCVICRSLGSYICLSCQKSLIYNTKDDCIYCGKPSHMGLTHFSCRRRDGVDAFMSCFLYNNPFKKIIKAVKYQLATEVLKELFGIHQEEFYRKLKFINQNSEEWLLQSIPLHIRRLKQRGFNQSDLIRDFYKKLINNSHVVTYLVRSRETEPQAQVKGKKQKYLNIKGVFSTREDYCLQNKNFILLDDVVTTGSTVKEACRILKQKKANKVIVLSLARG